MASVIPCKLATQQCVHCMPYSPHFCDQVFSLSISSEMINEQLSAVRKHFFWSVLTLQRSWGEPITLISLTCGLLPLRRMAYKGRTLDTGNVLSRKICAVNDSD